MAIGTTVPLSFVFAGIDREILTIMVPVCRRPGSLGVAILAGGWKLGRSMGRIGGLVVLRLVASDTGIRGSVVIPVVAFGAVCSD